MLLRVLLFILLLVGIRFVIQAAKAWLGATRTSRVDSRGGRVIDVEFTEKSGPGPRGRR